MWMFTDFPGRDGCPTPSSSPSPLAHHRPSGGWRWVIFRPHSAMLTPHLPSWGEVGWGGVGETWGKAGILLSMQIPFWSLFFQLDCLLSRVCLCTHRLNKVPSHPFFFFFYFFAIIMMTIFNHEASIFLLVLWFISLVLKVLLQQSIPRISLTANSMNQTPSWWKKKEP